MAKKLSDMSNVSEMKDATPGAPESPPGRSGNQAMTPFEEFDRLLEHVFDRGWMRPLFKERQFWDRFDMAGPRLPRVDLIDRDGEFVLRAEIPGVERDNLDVSIADNRVTIKGEQATTSKEEKGEYFRSEISRGTFARTLTLPGDVDPDKASASFQDGVLELILPKLKEARRRRIDIQ
ncbi:MULTISPECIES: Hsp20/alpha crystallin family protein [unclassified Modicisalibacter]|uniref:Hsp20/alpha crystallin family protein n=1 Tax=unclassified Modicisalibacter TaxID=2679913 RepID=UPI001CCCD342|nr:MULTISPECIES: Hsp20/alpha crystallin family protein [unclassified Modicisalibacter]MBZ9559626.1 Hsp20/alpha crystallin family protein [Modicisalibacter sp. R2A 31.J]MBZ9577078.1 Hsp20/alpha crystallin family protein [Modicisalibacter sp. MOD 31.J]